MPSRTVRSAPPARKRRRRVPAMARPSETRRIPSRPPRARSSRSIAGAPTCTRSPISSTGNPGSRSAKWARDAARWCSPGIALKRCVTEPAPRFAARRASSRVASQWPMDTMAPAATHMRIERSAPRISGARVTTRTTPVSRNDSSRAASGARMCRRSRAPGRARLTKGPSRCAPTTSASAGPGRRRTASMARSRSSVREGASG